MLAKLEMHLAVRQSAAEKGLSRKVKFFGT